MSKNLTWYINRLRCMSAGEIAHRVRHVGQIQLEQRGLFLASEVPIADTHRESPMWVFGPDSFCETLVGEADEIVAGKLNIFAHTGYELGKPPQWNTDPKTGTRVPVIFGKTINYRKEEVVGDIKYLWEPSRHLGLVTLAQAYTSTKESSYLDTIAQWLDSWLTQCPYPRGPQWISSLELGIRLINWSITWQLIGGEKSALFEGQAGQCLKQRWLESIYQHVHFINGYYSAYSSANNHLIGEAAGVFIACQTWPYWPRFEQWGETAKSILETEALAQNFGDGVNREQAISYQQFVLDFLILPLLCARANGSDFSSAYVASIEAMLEFTASMLDVVGNMPMLGDADDGFAVKLSQEKDFCPYRSLLATGAVLFNRADFKEKSQDYDQKSHALLGEDGRRVHGNLRQGVDTAALTTSFEQGGYYLLGSNFHEPSEIRLLMDAGPLGMGDIAAHGHADALSVYLSVHGSEILIDPGTYAYHTEKKWRDYFRGTSAHNTLRVDGVDQSEIGGNFMWLRKASVQVAEYTVNSLQSRLLASHDGYLAGRDPVGVSREVEFLAAQKRYRVTDMLSCKGSHGVEQFWHFSEEAEVICVSDTEYLVRNENAEVRFVFDAQLQISLVQGDEGRPSGWVSRSFDIKVPTSTLIAAAYVTSDTSFTTTIEILT